jgi:hypothetical protein
MKNQFLPKFLLVIAGILITSSFQPLFGMNAHKYKALAQKLKHLPQFTVFTQQLNNNGGINNPVRIEQVILANNAHSIGLSSSILALSLTGSAIFLYNYRAELIELLLNQPFTMAAAIIGGIPLGVVFTKVLQWLDQ